MIKLIPRLTPFSVYAALFAVVAFLYRLIIFVAIQLAVALFGGAALFRRR